MAERQGVWREFAETSKQEENVAFMFVEDEKVEEVDKRGRRVGVDAVEVGKDDEILDKEYKIQPLTTPLLPGFNQLSQSNTLLYQCILSTFSRLPFMFRFLHDAAFSPPFLPSSFHLVPSPSSPPFFLMVFPLSFPLTAFTP